MLQGQLESSKQADRKEMSTRPAKDWCVIWRRLLISMSQTCRYRYWLQYRTHTHPISNWIPYCLHGQIQGKPPWTLALILGTAKNRLCQDASQKRIQMMLERNPYRNARRKNMLAWCTGNRTRTMYRMWRRFKFWRGIGQYRLGISEDSSKSSCSCDPRSGGRYRVFKVLASADSVG